MADQAVSIVKDDVAAVAEELARSLWVEEMGRSPKASDANFFDLVFYCNKALRGMNFQEDWRNFAETAFKK